MARISDSYNTACLTFLALASTLNLLAPEGQLRKTRPWAGRTSNRGGRCNTSLRTELKT